MNSEIQIIAVNSKNQEMYIDAFIELYKKAFAEAPYFEKYSDAWVREHVWFPHLHHGRISVAIEKETSRLVGLGCAISIMRIPDNAKGNSGVKEFFLAQTNLPFDPKDTCYMSEVATCPDYRRKGVGLRLLKDRLQWSKEQGLMFYVMRTDRINTGSQRLYLKIGGQIISNLVQDVAKHAKEVNSSSKERILIFGKV